MNKSAKTYPSFRDLMNSMLCFLGPQEVLKEPTEFLTFQDNIKCDRNYFAGGVLLRTMVLDELPNKWSTLNQATAYENLICCVVTCMVALAHEKGKSAKPSTLI